MKKSIRFKIESQSESGKVTSLCFINEKSLALETSNIARVMFKNNRSLFDKINNSTKLVGGTIYRQETIRRNDQVNKLMVAVDNSHEFVEKEVINLTLNRNIVEPLKRVSTKSGRIIEFNYKNLKKSIETGSLDVNNPTEDDLRDSKEISSVSQVNLFNKLSIRTIILTDFLKSQESLEEFGYRISIKIETEFENYLNNILQKLNESASFLSAYSRSVSQNYDFKKMLFSDEFSKDIYSSLKIINGSKTDLNSKIIKQSDFGKLAIIFYNASLLLRENVDKNLYTKIMETLIPSSKTNYDKILNLEKSLRDLHDNIVKEYNLNNRLEKNAFKSKASRKTSNNNFINKSTDEKIKLEKFVLGYNVFGERDSGFEKVSPQSYVARQIAEQAKYYPSLSANEGGSIMTSAEKSNFSNLDGALGFVTPTSFELGDQTISTSRGMMNISPEKINEFRLAKSVVAHQKNSSQFTTVLPTQNITVGKLASLNITISRPVETILSRNTFEQIDPLIDAKRYLGESSTFITEDINRISNIFNKIKTKEEEAVLSIVSSIVPMKFLEKKSSIKSIRDIQFSNPDSVTRRLITENKIDLKNLPPHVKHMMTKSFVANDKLDALKHKDTREVIKETQTNLFELIATIGFEKDKDGIYDLYRPIERRIDKEVVTMETPMIVKARDFEIPELGIVKDKFAPIVYNNLSISIPKAKKTNLNKITRASTTLPRAPISTNPSEIRRSRR